MNKPTISFIDSSAQKRESRKHIDTLLSHWPVEPLPTFTSNDHFSADAALVFAEDDNQLLEVLPLILELQSLEIPTVLACDNLGTLADLVSELKLFLIKSDTEAPIISGILFGLIQRNEQVSLLQGQVGFVQMMHGSLQNHLGQLQSELETAAAVQREFMSNDVEAVHGIHFSTLWRPAGVVSGDMYDITRLDEDHVGFFITDAIGHGVSAAMLAMMLTRTLAANRFNPNNGEFTEPKEVMTLLNSALLQRSGEQARFATAAYGILNCKKKTLVFAGGGHPPAILSKGENTPQLLDSDGPLLGVFKDAQFRQCCVDLKNNDTLLLYSDGFEHALGNEKYEDTTIPSYIHALHHFCYESEGDIIDGINAYLNHSSVLKADDDLTMICISADAEAGELKLAA